MALLNKQAYAVEKDRLVYDAKHPIDASAVRVKISADEGGEIRRGQILDCAAGEYSVHAAGGAASAIVAEDARYTADDTEVTVVAYISGSFRASEVVSDSGLADRDIESLRGNGIYLK